MKDKQKLDEVDNLIVEVYCACTEKLDRGEDVDIIRSIRFTVMSNLKVFISSGYVREIIEE